jgi:ABC-type multidrug transport system fused ATPase/permease subunit
VKLRERNGVQFIRVLFAADRTLATLWWIALLLRGALPALFAIAMGTLVGAVARGESTTLPLVLVGVAFVGLQVLAPLHLGLSQNLGSRTAAWLYDRLGRACVTPPGIGHLEDPKLAADASMARDFDLGITAPPLFIAMDFIASGLVELVAGFASAIVLASYHPWAGALLAAAWLATHWLLRESGVWHDRQTPEVREAQQHADYGYRLAVDPPAAKELRLFGLADWVVDRFAARRKQLYELQWHATRLRERSVALSLLLVTAANLIVLYALAVDLNSGAVALDRAVTFASAAVGTSAIAFGGLSWALDGAAAPAAAVLRLQQTMGPVGALPLGERTLNGAPARELRFRDVSFTYPGSEQPVLSGLSLTIPAGSSLAIVGQNGAGKTTLAKLLCRMYDPQDGAIEIDGVDLRDLDVDSWRARVTAVFQDFIRFELPLRDNVDPEGGASEGSLRAALQSAGAEHLAELDTILARGYPGGTELSGGQWQRVALARALCAVRRGAGLVLLDEPTAQLDVRGEAEIFERILRETRKATTILVSHRFSTVRHADRICVLEHGKVLELGTHDELIALGGRYCTMFELQASRFGATTDEEGMAYDALG